MKNVFHNDHDEEEMGSLREIKISEYNYLPSIELKLMGDEEEIERLRSDSSVVWTEAIEFDDKDIRLPSVNIENLNKYLKFYVKYYKTGSNVENRIFRSNLVNCKSEMFKGLNLEEY